MFASGFDYYKVSSVAEAIQSLRSHQGAKLLAGGHSLLPMMKLRLARPTALVDIGGLTELKGVGVRNGVIHIGPLTTHHAIASSEQLGRACPLLTEAAGEIGDPQVRNRGTIGGNVSHADPSSDWPAALTALNARFVAQGSGGRRTISAAGFFKDVLVTDLGEEEILVDIEVPVLSPNHRTAYAKMAHPATFSPIVSAAAVLTVSGNRCTEASIVVGGLVPRPVRATSVENALRGQQLTLETIGAAAAHVARDLGSDVLGDVYASAEYRRAVAPVEVKHAIYHAAGLAHH